MVKKYKKFRLLGSPKNNPVIIRATSRTDAYKKYGRSYGNQGASDWTEIR